MDLMELREELMMTAPDNLSQQPRFSDQDAKDFFSASYHLFWTNSEDAEPPYTADSRRRDKWLSAMIHKESHLAGVLNTLTAIDKNRGWRMVGGRNQVIRYTDILHTTQAAPDLWGWRPAISMLSESFWSSNIGAICEIGRDVRSGPLRALYTVDPLRCRLTGDNNEPLQYFPAKGGQQNWATDDYFRVVSMPSKNEKFNGLGYCFVDRAIELTKLLIAIYAHDHEQLGTRAPKGLLLIKGVSQKQWDNAMQIRDAQIAGNRLETFDSVAVLANPNADVDAKLIAISNLPINFDFREFMDMMMYGYALTAGYDPSELWPVQYGAMGRGTEGTLQHEKATGKGRLDFPLGLQEQLQMELPATLEFEFEQRDDQEDLTKAQIFNTWADVARKLYEAGHMTRQGSLLNRAQALALLADNGIIPANWAPVEDVSSTDKEPADDDQPIGVDDMPNTDTQKGTYSPAQTQLSRSDRNTFLKLARDRILSKKFVWRTAHYFPAEPIVQYVWPDNSILTVFERADDIFNPTIWPVERIVPA